VTARDGGVTARLVIEPLAPHHAPALFAALDDDRVGTYIGGPDVTTLEALERRIVALLGDAPAGQEWRNWVVSHDGNVVGRLEATLHDDIAEIAYVFAPSWWGHGFATESGRWLVERLDADVAQQWATVMPGNAASIGLLGRLGFAIVDDDERRDDLMSYDDGDVVFFRPRPGQ
jgi:RimJ/RimL family protein N-acetyltransferase